MFLLAVGSILATAGFAQEKKESKHTAPAAAKAAFEKAFPGVSKVKWGQEGKEYEANFVQNGKKMSAVYDSRGVLKETEEDIKITELPAAVAAYVKEHHKGAAIKEAAKITKPNGEVNYEAEVNKMDLIFDANGKFIKAEKD
jgi:hypothetical protein